MNAVFQDRQALALQSGPFRGMDEETARRLNYALYGALVKLESVDSGELEGTFMGINFGQVRDFGGNGIFNGEVVIALGPGLYRHISFQNFLRFEILQAVRYNCAFCGGWDGPDKLMEDEFAPHRLVHRRDCLNGGGR